jgi:hypothetical protein
MAKSSSVEERDLSYQIRGDTDYMFAVTSQSEFSFGTIFQKLRQSAVPRLGRMSSVVIASNGLVQ